MEETYLAWGDEELCIKFPATLRPEEARAIVAETFEQNHVPHRHRHDGSGVVGLTGRLWVGTYMNERLSCVVAVLGSTVTVGSILPRLVPGYVDRLR